MLRTLVIALILLAFAIAGALAYLGAFARVIVVEQRMGPHRFVYRTLEGADPRRVGEITDQVAGALRAVGVTHIQPLDLYYPPGAGKPNEIGWAVTDQNAAALATLDGSYLRRTIPAEYAMVARFPWKHPLSYAVGFFKVDPALRAHRQANGYRGGPSYTLHEGDAIVYVQPVVR